MNIVSTGILVSLCLSSSTFPLLRAQTAVAVASRGALEGRVLDSVTGQPIEGVQVTLVSGQPLPEAGVQSLLREQKPSAQAPQITKVVPGLVFDNRRLTSDRTAHSVLTDPQGRFAFSGLAAADYSLAVRADGYNFQVYGEKPESLTWLPIEIRDTKTDLGVIRMSPEPRISGTVVDLDGNPVPTMPVYLLNGQPMISIDGDRNFRVAGETVTDANGRYILQKIAAGDYYIAAGGSGRPAMVRVSAANVTDGPPRREQLPALRPQPYTYYPAVPDISLAAQLHVPAGSKVELGDLVLTKAELRTLRGHVVDYTTGKPPKSVRLALTALSPFLRAGRTPTEPVSNVKYDQTTGVFEAANLIPGRYRIDAVVPTQRTSTPQPVAVSVGGVSLQSAFEIVELGNADVQDLELGVPANGRVAGKVVVAEGKSFPVAERNLSIPFQLMLRPLMPLQPAPVVTSVSLADGTFEVASRLEGKYRFSIAPLRDNYYVSEARVDGIRITDGILDISSNATSELVFTLAPGGEVQGYVVDRNGQPVRQAQGLLLPDPLPETIPFYQPINADAGGHFTVNGVPPGNFKIFIWDGIEPAQFFDRELLLRSSTRAAQVHVEKGSSGIVAVKIIEP